MEEVASPQAFRFMPEKVHRFYNMRRAALRTVEPNAAHHALVRLERAWPGEFLLVTQNVDDLHDRAGSQKLLHMHGELSKVRCTACGAVYVWEADLQTSTACEACQKTGGMRPDIVWFGEMPVHMDTIMTALSGAGIFVSIGTSGLVYPAAGFVAAAGRNADCRCIEINLEDTPVSGRFNEKRQGAATTEVPKLVEELLAAAG